jgi:hypothetical protein
MQEVLHPHQGQRQVLHPYQRQQKVQLTPAGRENAALHDVSYLRSLKNAPWILISFCPLITFELLTDCKPFRAHLCTFILHMYCISSLLKFLVLIGLGGLFEQCDTLFIPRIAACGCF